MTSSRDRSLVRKLLVGALSTCMLYGATAASAEPCTVTYRSVTQVTYSKYNLNAFIYSGTYESPSPGGFSLSDDDGFLTLAALVSGWQSSGKAQRNTTSAVELLPRELALVLAATEMGQAYQRAVRSSLRDVALAAREPNWAANIAEAERREAIMNSIQSAIVMRQDIVGPGAPVTLPAGFIALHMGASLNQLVPGASPHISTQYADGLAVRRGSRALCDPEAASWMVGRGLCGRDFVTHRRRDAFFCLDGLVIADVTAARSCLGTITSGSTVSADSCVSEFGAPRTAN